MNGIPERHADLPRWSFGDSAELADELLALVLAGKKTATCGALWQYERDGVAIPATGERSIVLDGANRPRCVVETTEVNVKRFDTVDAQFARDEGEGDQSYTYWRETHETYFRRQGQFSEDMLVVCERFRVIEKLESAQ
jgi:uncharacterized protein YhfF